ncbi:MAG: polysaccharide deacetylase, partial [Candidatus Competibacter sp.]|nr:polysaccharide deacetylase [Candidatus Competibacter sp.]
MSKPSLKPKAAPLNPSPAPFEHGGVTIKPVFFDPTNKRWPRLRAGMMLVALSLTALLGGLLLSVLASPVLPSLNLPGASFLPQGAHAVPTVPSLAPARALTRRERALQKTKLKLARERERDLKQLLAQTRTAPPLADKKQLAIGFFVNWDDSSMTSLKQNLDSLDMVIAEWLHLADDEGLLRENDPIRQSHATAYIRDRRPDFSIVPLVNNWNGQEWEGDKLGRMLAKPAARARVIEQLSAYVERHHFAGVSVDFENIPAKAQPDFQRFMAELHAAFQPKRLSVSVNVPADDPAFDYRKLANSADYLIVMAYDEHWSTGAPGPIASLPWFAKVLRQRRHDIPAEKMIVAIGNYGYDWQAGGHAAEERTFEEAVLVAKESEGLIRLDPASLNPHFDYADDDDRIHHVWMLDAVTAFNQLAVIRSIQPRGIALWRMGSEDPTLWKIFGKADPPDATLAKELGEIHFGYGLDYEGQGEILEITARPQGGVRT